MNLTYRLIWSEISNTWVAVSEATRARGKRSASGAVLLLAAMSAFAAPPAANQLPTGGQVSVGNAAIQQSGAVMNINQTTQRAAVNWNTFDVGGAAQVNFNQPGASSVTLNRVLDSNPSQIFGKITAPGQVFLTNPNGVYFAPGAVVDVGGLVATTHTISDTDFMAGLTTFSRNGATGSIINQGELKVAIGGYIALLAPEVRNEGVIVAQAGTVALAAGEAITLNFGANNALTGLTVTASQIKALVENKQVVLASDGLIILSARAADSLQGSVVNNAGTLEAASLKAKGGRIILEGDDITLTSSSRMDASGATGGGTVLVGGDWQGSGMMHQATAVTMEAGASIDASATQTGDGGKVVLWSDVQNANSSTSAHGTILARGGLGGGNGGQVETSGHQVDIDNVHVNAGADRGIGGLWLIDPYSYTIGSSQALAIVGDISSGLNSGTSVTVDTVLNTSSYGSSGNVSDAGDITVSAAINKTLGGDATLTLKAARHISLQSGATINSSSGKLNLQLWADSDNSGDGIIQLASSSISTNGGWLKFGNNQSATINGSSVLVGGDVFFNGASAQTLSTGGGNLNIYGETILANPYGITINTSGGNATFSGVLNSGNQYTWVDKTTDTGHDWNWARTDAKNGTAGGSALNDSYLVTITSRLENAIAGLTAGYRGAWIGAYRANPTSSFAWTWADGPEAGVQFFTQNSSGGGGTTTSGYYSNYGSGEPNGTLTANESVGQFFGTAGQWNDLSQTTTFSATQGSQYNVLGYVRETNLAPTALTINAGSGVVAFNNSVGGSKALASLTVNGASTLPNSITTIGAQTYNGAVQLVVDTTLTTTNSNITFGSTVDSADAANPKNLTANILADPTYYWVDWTSSDTTHVYGTITVGADTIGVTYSNANGFFGAQVAGGTNFWTGLGGAAFVGASPYVSTNVANGPTSSDIIQLQYQGSQTLTFSQSVENLAFSIVSMNGNGYGFDQNFDIASYSGYKGAGAGYWGGGAMVKVVSGSTYQLNDGGMNASSVGHSEPHGTIRFTGGFSQLTWQSLSNELWNGFTVGVSGTSAAAGTVHFNGTAGGSAALGAITVNGAMQTTANINAASSLSVTGNSNLGGNITTSGDQNYGSAVTLSSNATLTTLNNGSVSTTSTIDGAHNLTVSTNGTGNTSFGGTVGGATALTGLNVTTDVLSAAVIALAASSALDITNGGSSLITGVISGTDATLTKAGSGTLKLSGANTYTGGTTISAGILQLGSVTSGSITNGPLGTGSVKVDGGASVDLAGYSLANALDLSGTGVSGNGALYNSTSTSVTVSGNTTLSADTTIKSESGGNLNYSGTINGAHGLIIDTNGISSDATVTISGVVGGATPLTGFSIDSGSSFSTLSATSTVAGPISIYGGNITLNAGLTATGTNTTSLTSTGSITEGASGFISSYMLALLGGNVTLTNANNSIGTLAASSVSGLTYIDRDALTIGTVGSTSGVSATGAVSIGTATGDLTLAQNVATTDATSSALVLNAGINTAAGTATGGNIVLSGNPMVSTSGTATLYTGSISGSTGLTALVGSGTGRFRYNSDESISHFTQVLSTGLNAIYREQPTISSVAVDNQVITYGNATPTWTFTMTGGQNGDTLAQAFSGALSVQVNGSTSTSGNYTAGSSHTLTASGNLGTSLLGYANTASSYTTGMLTVGQKTLNVSYTGDNRTYDGTTSATVTTSDNRVTNDVLTISSTTSFVDKNAANSVAINISGASLSDTDAANYILASTIGSTTANIGKKVVTLSAAKTYDGTTDLTGKVSIGTGISGETLSYTGATDSDAHVATANKYISTLTLADQSGATSISGGLASNYQLPTLDAANAPVTINTKALSGTASIAGTLTKIYDGTTGVDSTTASVGGSVGGAVSGDTISLDTIGVTLAYNSAHVVGANGILASGSAGFSIDSSTHGSLASDYSFSTPSIASATAHITQEMLTLSLTNAGVTKTYDGTMNAPAGFVPAWSVAGLVMGDTAADVSSTTAAFNSKNVLDANKITVSGADLTGITGNRGSATSDYVLASTSVDAAATITPATLNLSAAKTYDGTTDLAGKVSIGTGISGETLTYTAASANDAQVATANKYISALTLADQSGATTVSGGLTSNYQLPTLDAANAPVTINTQTLNVTANNASKTFDGRPYVGGNGVHYVGFVAGEGSADLGGALTYGGNSQHAVNAGSYVITPLGLTSNNYAITFFDGVLAIGNFPPPPPPPIVNSGILQMPSHAVTESNPALPESGGLNVASISGNNISSVGDISAVEFDGIKVTLERKPDVSIEGVVAVSISKKLAKEGGLFSIALPADVISNGARDKVILTLPDGNAVPDWLSYSPVKRAIEVHHIPPNGLPIKVIIISSSKHTLVTITEKLEGLSRL